MSVSETAAEIDAAAAAWVARVESGRLDSAGRRALDAWLARSDRHHGAYVRATAMWSGIGGGGLDWERLDEPALPPRRWSRRGLIAGGAGVAAGVGAILLVPGLRGLWSPRREFSTALGEQRRLALGSASSVLLDTESALATRSAGGTVELLRGNALFSVAERLAVTSSNAVLNVAEASFMMALGNFGTRITVTRGLVYLVVDGARPFELGAGVRAEIADGTATVRRIGNEEIARALAWSQGTMLLAGESLAEAAATMNRYNRLKVVLGPGAPIAEALVGRFSLRDPQGFADAVAKLYGLSVRPEAGVLMLTDVQK